MFNSPQSSTRKLLSWWGSHPITSIFILLAVFGIGAHWFANWQAERDWQNYCTAARARGVKLYLSEFAPPEVPDRLNFAALPMFKGLAYDSASPATPLRAGLSSKAPQSPLSLDAGQGTLPDFGRPLKGGKIDWREWQTYFKNSGLTKQTSDSGPRDALAALEQFAPQVREWEEWKTRPSSRFPLDYNAGAKMASPHLSVLLHAEKLFALSMRARLALCDSSTAYVDFRNGLQTYLAIKDEPTLISGLVRIANLSVLIAAMGDGLSDHQWTDGDLQKMEADLSSIRIWDDYRLAFSSERGFVNASLSDLADASPWKRKSILSGFTGPIPQAWMIILIPRCVFRDNQLRSNQDLDEMSARVSADGSGFDADMPNPSKAENLAGTLEEWHYFLFKISAPVYEGVAKRYVSTATKLSQARIACALERFYLASASFPETLTELVPNFIAEVPPDIYSGKPMIYRRQGDKSYLLYSVGSNRMDDHGVIDPKKIESRQPDDVWLYAPR